jgi:hypothetical protein
LRLKAVRIERKQNRVGGSLESLVDLTAIFVVMGGLFLAVIPVVLMTFEGLLPSITILLGTYFFWLFLRCLAEHLRLLKKMAGLPFDGCISGQISDQNVVWICGNCGNMLHSETRCEGCGAEIETSDAYTASL